MFVMMKFIAIFVVFLHAGDLIDACGPIALKLALMPTVKDLLVSHERNATQPSKPFLIDRETPIYLLLENTFEKTNVASINNRMPINYMKFYVDDGDIEPYTLFLKTVVIVDQDMAVNKYRYSILDRIMSFMSTVESAANNRAIYPKIKLVVTAIFVALHPRPISFLEPNGTTTLNIDTDPNPLHSTQYWLSRNSYAFRDGLDADFVLVISGADYSSPGWGLINRFGSFNCKSGESSINTPPVIIVSDKVPNNDYALVYYQFMDLIQPQLRNWPCDKAFLTREYEQDNCYLSAVQQDFYTTFPRCLLRKPAFLNQYYGF